MLIPRVSAEIRIEGIYVTRAYWSKQRKSADPEGWEAARKARRFREGRKKNIRAVLCARARQRGRELGVPATISRRDLEWPHRCPVLGTVLDYDTPRGMRGSVAASPENLPSLDRLVPEWGYAPGNVFVISHRANTLKNSSTVDELRAIIQYMEAVAI